MILKNLKRLVSVGVISLLSGFIILGCNNFTGLSIDDSNPASSYTKEEIERLQKIDAKYQFVSRMDRAAAGSERDQLIEELEPEMIAALHEEFGEEAVKFYGSSEISDGNTSRSVSVPGSSYTVNVSAYGTEHWGVWWDYFTISVNCYTYVASNKMDYHPDISGWYHYKDPITDKSHTEDYAYLDSDAYKKTKPKSSGGFMGGAGLKWEIDDAIARANRGKLSIEGNHKNGWFPKLKTATLEVEFKAKEFNGKTLTSAWTFTGR